MAFMSFFCAFFSPFSSIIFFFSSLDLRWSPSYQSFIVSFSLESSTPTSIKQCWISSNNWWNLTLATLKFILFPLLVVIGLLQKPFLLASLCAAVQGVFIIPTNSMPHVVPHRVLSDWSLVVIVFWIVMKNKCSELTRLDWVGIRLNQFEMFEERFKLLSRWNNVVSSLKPVLFEKHE